MLTRFAALVILVSLGVQTEGSIDCLRDGQSYTNLAFIFHENGCAKLQCQYGTFVTYYEACDQQVDGLCHRLNVMFQYQDKTYQCRKIQVGQEVQYQYQVVLPGKNCLDNGKTYQSLEKFRRDDGCRVYQCQNGEIVALDPVCGQEIDGNCHLLGEIFEKDGTVYTCTSRIERGDIIFENIVLNPKPSKTRSCTAAQKTYRNLDVFRLLPVCNLRQCQDRRIKILTDACAFKREGIQCYQLREQWNIGDTTYGCRFNASIQQATSEIVKRGFKRCRRNERAIDHLEINTRPDGCVSVQCQDGASVAVRQGCLWNVDNQCHELNSIWRNDKGRALKCILTDDGLYRVGQLDKNGNIIERPAVTEVVPVYEKPCPTLAADIILVLDSSGSISSTTFKKVLNFTVLLTGAFTVGPDNVNFGLIVFSGVARKIFDLNNHYEQQSLSQAIRRVPYLGDITETQKAFNLIVDGEMFEPDNGGRDAAPNIVILITDGTSTNTINTLAAVDRVKAQGTAVLVVGVGHVAENELHGIASQPENVFQIKSYKEINSIIKQLSTRTCEARPPPPLEFCLRNGQRYENLAIINHDNGCARLQCQFGKFVTYYEACGKEVDGLCHRLNFLFEYQGDAFQCRKIQVGDDFQYENQLAIPRIENCTDEGRIHESLEKFRRSDGCREYQCQNGVIVPLDPMCGKEIDGKCHLVGEYFDVNGTVYVCTNRTDGDETVFENLVLNPRPLRSRPCTTATATYKNFDLFRILPLCNLRQCQDRKVQTLTQACAFKREDITCHQIGEQWKLGETTYFCGLSESTNQAKSEIVDKGRARCKRNERWYAHLEIFPRQDGCSAVQCQNGKVLPVQEGCLWSEDNTCHDLNSLWKSDSGAIFKCKLTKGQYKAVQLS